MTFIANLLESFVATAIVTSFSVYALVRTNMLASFALVYVHARDTIHIQLVSWRTGARVAAFGILAMVFARWRMKNTFVDICKGKRPRIIREWWEVVDFLFTSAVKTGIVHFESFIAYATVWAKSVDALSIVAQIWYCFAFIHIYQWWIWKN